MKFLYLPLVCLSILFLSACEKNDPSPTDVTQPILTLRVDASYKTDRFENWVLVHNTDGKLLAYKEFEAGDLVKLNTTKEVPDNKVHVTFLRHNKTDSTDYFTIETYLAVSEGEEWKLKIVTNPEDVRENKTGTFNVHVSGIGEGYFSITGEGAGNRSLQWTGGSTNTLDGDVDILGNAPDIFVYAADQLGNPRYKLLENVNDKDAYDFSFLNMSTFDHLVKVECPEYTNFFVLVTADPHYDINSTLGSVRIQPMQLKNFTLGFLDAIENYKTLVSVTYHSNSLSYYRVGTRPQSIKLPFDAEFSITDKKIQSFTYTGNQSITMRSSEWSCFETWDSNSNNPKYKTIGRWYVTSAEGSQAITELPTEFSTRYPSFDMNKFTHGGTTFRLQSQSYSEFLGTAFKDRPQAAAFEETSVSIH